MNYFKIKTILSKSELFRNTSILISGTVIAQLIPIMLQPILRRFYSPETFGAYSIYLSLLGIFVVISSLKYELAIVLPKKDRDAANLLFVTVCINLIFNLALLLIIVSFKNQILLFLNLSEKYALYLYFIPLGTFLFNLYQGINYFLIRKKQFFPISINKFVRRGTEGIGQISLIASSSSAGLVIGDIIGHCANCISGGVQLIKKESTIFKISQVKAKYVLKKYFEYPKFNVIPSFMSACSYLLPAIMINKFYSSEYTGYFDLAKLMLSIPLALIATSISNVLLQMISEKFRSKGSIISDLFLILIFVSMIAAFEILIIRIWGVQIFDFVFGNDWIYSGEISRILVWSFTFNFFIASFSSIFISMKKIKILSVWQFIYFLAIISLTFFKESSFEDFLKIYVLIEVVCYTIISVIIISIIARYESGLLKHQEV
ncbi:MAG: oligosaccharide flippase family protein [Bacteroidales bacterium]|nr:oligosaccharide flippase family protein [Bacteroidales bacterium]